MSNKKDSDNSLVLTIEDLTFNYIIFDSSYRIIKMFHEEFSFEKGLSIFSLIEKYDIKNAFFYENPALPYMEPIMRFFFNEYLMRKTNLIQVTDDNNEWFDFTIPDDKYYEHFTFRPTEKSCQCWISHNPYIKQYNEKIDSNESLFRQKMHVILIRIFWGNEHFRLSKKSPSKFRMKKEIEESYPRIGKSFIEKLFMKVINASPDQANAYLINTYRDITE